MLFDIANLVSNKLQVGHWYGYEGNVLRHIVYELELQGKRVMFLYKEMLVLEETSIFRLFRFSLYIKHFFYVMNTNSIISFITCISVQTKYSLTCNFVKGASRKILVRPCLEQDTKFRYKVLRCILAWYLDDQLRSPSSRSGRVQYWRNS